MSFEFFMSQRYLRMKQKEGFISLITFLSVAGVAVGVMALIVVIAVMSGAEIDIREKILGIQSHMIVMHYGGVISNVDPVMDRIKDIPNVMAVTPVVYSQVMLRSSTQVSGAIIRGIDPQSAGKVTDTLKNVSGSLTAINEERLTSADQIPAIVLGKGLAANLNVKEGDTLYLIAPRGLSSPQGYVPSRKRFKISGIFSFGMHEYDQSMAYIHIHTAQEMLRMEKQASVIAIRLKNIFHARDTAEVINSALGFPYWARDWMQLNHNLFSALKLQKTVMFIILTLIILVAAFNIASALIMMVMQKTKDIAILNAMGATKRSLIKIFVFKGLALGVVGTIIGVCLGSLLCSVLKHYHFIELPGDVYYFTTLPVMLESFDVIKIASSTLFLCFIATLYPAVQASRLNPLDAIRYG